MTIEPRAFQDAYPDHLAVCYGCGRYNEHGVRIRSFWEGDEGVCRVTPRAFERAFPGIVYGGLVASIIDCHCIGTAAAATARAEGRELESDPPLRFVTGTLEVKFLRPTPLGVELVCRARADEIGPRKVVLSATLHAGDFVTATGRVVAVRVPDAIVDLARAGA